MSLTLLIRKQKQSQALWYRLVSAATPEAEKGGFRTKAGPEPLNEFKVSCGGSVRPFWKDKPEGPKAQFKQRALNIRKALGLILWPNK